MRPFAVLPLTVAVAMAPACSSSSVQPSESATDGTTPEAGNPSSSGIGGSTGGGADSGGSTSSSGSGSGADSSSGSSGSSGSGSDAGSGGSTDASGSTDAGGSRDAASGDSPSDSGSTEADSGTGQGPCDIYQAANTPCVAAHSTVRALYASYTGALYEVTRASDKTTKDIPVGAGGFADTAVQDSFCAGTTCTISIIYDQSLRGNDLKKAPPGATWLPNGGNESSTSKGKTSVGGHTVYGIYVTGFSDNVAYRNNKTNGVATANQAEAMYMVVDGARFSSSCCFDYGNAEKDSKDDGNGTMEAIYWGTDTAWGGFGEGAGPWVAADLENGMFKGDKGGFNYGVTNTTPWPTAQSVIAKFATTMLKGPSVNTFTLKAGNAQSGSLTTMWNSSRPSPNYSPKTLQGAIILGTGGDGSNGGTGTFFEGAMTSGSPPDAVDDAIQANIISAGYGR
jgi:hypothetical protein